MAKITLTDITSGFNLSNINGNFQALEDELNDKVFYRDNTGTPLEPNSLAQNLDANNFSLLNVDIIDANDFSVGGANPTGILNDATAQADAAEASAIAAALSEVGASLTLEEFSDIYYGPLASDPATAPSGAASTEGDVYFNTALSVLKTFDGVIWFISTTVVDDNSITTVKIVDLAVTEEKLADNAVATDKIENMAVATAKIDNDAVTTLKLADLNVTKAKIAVLAISTGKIVDEAVTGAKIKDGTITPDKLADGQFGGAYARLADEQPADTNGGTFTSGARRTRTLNSEYDPSGIVTLSSNQFTLSAGTYRISACAPTYKTGPHKAYFRNITDASDVFVGTPSVSDNAANGMTKSNINGEFTIAGSKTFEIQHICDQTQANNGFGNGHTFSDGIETYTVVELWKVI